MKRVFLKNGMTLIYKYNPNNLTSFSIAFEAGANLESDPQYYGVAHALEHMVYKGTKNYTEDEINEKLDKLFGFNNAMTNYPYVVYYGTCLSEDFEEGIKLYGDILKNPSLAEEGFKEEMKVILEELKEWKEDLYQACEDEAFYNAFTNRRIKELIIGNEQSLKNIGLNHIKEFYERYYTADNCVISVISSLDFKRVLNLVEDTFKDFTKKLKNKSPYILNKTESIYEENKHGTFKSQIGSKGAKVQIIYPIHRLSEEEIKALRVFNVAFGEGTSSFIYDEIRTKKGIAYDVGSTIKNEKGIKILKIYLGTSKENAEKAIDIILRKTEELKASNTYFTQSKIKELVKSLKLKRSLLLERSIQESASLANYEIMYGDFRNKKVFNDLVIEENYISPLYKELNELESIDDKIIMDTIKKVFQNPTIQILE